MATSRRLEGLRSSRLDHSMQNFMAELLEHLPRPDSLDLLPKLRKNEGAIAEGGTKTKKWPYLDAQKASEALDCTIRCRISWRSFWNHSRGLIRPILHDKSQKIGGLTAEGGKNRRRRERSPKARNGRKRNSKLNLLLRSL